MYGKGSLLIALFLAPASLNFGNGGDPLARITAIYRHADVLFHLTNNTPETDSTALAEFEQVIATLEMTPAHGREDTLLFGAWLKKGILLDSRYDYSGAKAAYCKALSLHPPSDSLIFVTHIYVGASYYNLNNFDSAKYFLQIAESHSARFRDPDDQVRLYNTLGVLFYDNGNYEQGKNYFNKALEIVRSRKPLDTVSAVGLETNIATSCYHLGLFRESLDIYHRVLYYHPFNDPVYLDMGMAYASLDDYREAMICFHKVKAKNLPGVLNEMGNAELQLRHPDSAAHCLDELRILATKQPVNAIDLGTNDLYQANLLAAKDQYLQALGQLQQAIIIYSSSFHNTDIYANPANFIGTFTSYRLFDALVKKASLFEQLYRQDPKEQYLIAAYAAYQSTLAIMRYIEKSYDTDDAKLFLKKRNSDVYQDALAVCLRLYKLHPGAGYLEQAFLIGEKSKASVITANLQERKWNSIGSGQAKLLQQEENIKYNIARLNVQLEKATAKQEQDSISREKAGYEIGLSRLQQSLEQNGAYYKLKYADSTPGVKELQKYLGPKQALISCYLTPQALHIFALTASSFLYARVDSLAALQRDVDSWLTLLKTTENGRKFKGEALGSRLGKLLVGPIRAMAPDKDEWIIVPDGFLYFLPFESLPSAGGDPLVETTTISYQFAARLIIRTGNDEKQRTTPGGILAFAPFAGRGGGGLSGHELFPRLPASAQEIAGLPGRQYLDSQATKAAFLHEIGRYPIVHLATHAVSSIRNAAGSFVAFYPQKGNALEDNLYLEELYGLDMHATQLVVISACETGQGELVSNEGVISLARAFAYAGCKSTISSLWKADDEATSFILQHFYIYLQRGYTKAKALRQAKLDYLRSGAINKSPAYWAHLVLIGDTSPIYHSSDMMIIAAVLAGMLTLLLLTGWIWLRRKRGK